MSPQVKMNQWSSRYEPTKFDLSRINIANSELNNILKNVQANTVSLTSIQQSNMNFLPSQVSARKRSKNYEEKQYQKKIKIEPNTTDINEKVSCKSCGLKIGKNAYNQHLDWHFQMNMKDKKIARQAKKVVKTFRG